MTWRPIFANEVPLPLVPAGDLAAVERGAGVVRCYTCGHPIWAHFQAIDGAGGCAAVQAPAFTIEAAVRGYARKPFVGSSACLCPGWTRGQLPRELTKHLTALTGDDTAGCGRCEHPLSDHSEEQGCHFCPCTNHAPAGQ